MISFSKFNYWIKLNNQIWQGDFITKINVVHLVYKAFLNDPLVKGRASEEDVKALADEMIENTKKYLPEGWK